MLKVKEIFYSLQGEGYNTGRPAVFVRFSGCNLWSGRDVDRNKSPCFFCDTGFIGGCVYTESDLAEKIISTWRGGGQMFVVFTGGEPTLQLKDSLLSVVRQKLGKDKQVVNFAIETNGTTDVTYQAPVWVTVSPKTKDFLRRSGNELKLLWPLENLHPSELDELDFRYKYLQPIDDENYEENVRTAVEFCLDNSTWRLSMQQHKLLGIR